MQNPSEVTFSVHLLSGVSASMKVYILRWFEITNLSA